MVEEAQLLPWDQPGWFERVEPWVAGELARLGLVPRGKLELVRVRPWAAVARLATVAGDIWFKEPAPSLAYEPALTAAVSRYCPDFTPEVLATQQAWMLTRDAGEQLRAVRERGDPKPTWDELFPLYAELQIELGEVAPELLALGTPDKRPAIISADYPRLVESVAARSPVDVTKLRALAPQVESLVHGLAGPLPATLIHEEFHAANVFVRGERPRLLDWAEAAVSHPFAGVVNTLRDIAFRRRLKPNGRELLRLRSIYLEPWTSFASPAELHELLDRGYMLGALCRAMTWDRFLAGQSAAVRAEYSRNAAVWLDIIFRQAIEDGVKLGA
jgi:Phosphotransferase enzyme family